MLIFKRILIILASTYLISGFAGHKALPTPIICKQQYALCASAACIPDPAHPSLGICLCSVQNGYNIGYSNCQHRLPIVDKYNVIHLISTFSFRDMYNKKAMNCKHSPWTNCLDKACVIDPSNQNRALCSCPIMPPSEFVTFGGNCDLNTCNTGFWSGNTIENANTLRSVFNQSTTESMPENAACSPQ